VGGSLLLAGQMFKAEGQQALTSQSASPDRVTNRGTAYSFGAGLRVGGYWRAHEMLSLGASWSPRVAMSRFEEYEGLLADRGRFDIPETLMAGLQFSPSPALSLMLDYQRIRYSGTDALANPGFDGSALRGSNGGPGNGWRDLDVYKLGVRYQATPALRVSAGMSASSRVFDDKDTTHNLTTPSTFRRHYTLGAGYTHAPGTEWSFFYARSPKRTTTGTSALASGVVSQFTGVPTAAGQESLSTSLHAFGIQYSIRH
jgi:long-chain fatty acid transport protein